jgi:hypothetical protein
MSSPIGSSTVEAREQGTLADDGAGFGRLSLDPGGSEQGSDGLQGTVVWEAVGLIAPGVPAETERRLSFRGMPQAIGAARRVLRAWEGHFEPDLFYDLSLCVSELVTNRVRHTSASAPVPTDEQIELLVRRDQERVRVEVSQPRSAEIAGGPPAEPHTEWELFIVDRIADRWGLDSGERTVMWCEIDLAGDGWSRQPGQWPAAG